VLFLLGQVLGGIGLFLLAIKLITDGLSIAAGNSLRNFLAKATRTPMRGILSGALITSIVQSSSAVTVAIIGFVNAGILTLYQAMGVVFGANIGTTMTGWLVSMIGLNFKLALWALPLVGIGMLAQLFMESSRIKAIGEVLTGFGLFFIGIEVLKNAFAGLSQSIELATVFPDNTSGLFLYMAMGFVITVLTQSSSAAVAMILTAVSSGALGFDAAAAMVIGANVGTTSTAALAVIGATPNAKRVALAHIIFNVFTGVVALVLLPLVLWLVAAVGSLIGLEQTAVVSLALFHTVFNILGVVLMWPLSARLTTFLKHRFTSVAEHEIEALHLDATTLGTPTLAVNAVWQELSRVQNFVLHLGQQVLLVPVPSRKAVHELEDTTENILTRVRDFTVQLYSRNLSKETANQLPGLMRVSQYFHTATVHATFLREHHSWQVKLLHTALKEDAESYLFLCRNILKSMQSPDAEDNMASFPARIVEAEERYQALKQQVLSAGTSQQVEVQDMVDILELLSHVRAMMQQLAKAIMMLSDQKQALEYKVDVVPVNQAL